MKATEILAAEHEVIIQVLNCLERFVQNFKSERSFPREAAAEILDFLSIFADACHHGKEEEHLFLFMEARGMPRHTGPTGVMLYEHDQGRNLIREMKTLLASAQVDDSAKVEFCRASEQYVSLLRQHIHKENHCLFPMADSQFSEQDQKDLLTAFQKTEHEKFPGIHSQYLKLAKKLAVQFQIEQKNIGPKDMCACQGHS